MPFREQLTLCPRCYMLIVIDLILIDERAVVRIIGDCTNPDCRARNICFDFDPFQLAVESAPSSGMLYFPAQSKLWGN